MRHTNRGTCATHMWHVMLSCGGWGGEQGWKIPTTFIKFLRVFGPLSPRRHNNTAKKPRLLQRTILLELLP